MRITFICPPPDLTGGQRVIATYARRLQQRGHRVTVVTPRWPRPTVRQIARSVVKQRRWPAVRPRVTYFDAAEFEHRMLDGFRPVTDRDVPDADVVIATWWETAEWVQRLAPSKGEKVYFIQHHEVFDFLPIARVEATWRLPMRKIVVAQWLADVARDCYGDAGATVVRNAVDTALFHAGPREKGQEPVVGLVYLSDRSKGCDISLAAVRAAEKRLPGLRLVSFGHRQIDPQLPLPESAKYHISPPQVELKTIYSRCDAWLFGSRTEGFGLPILEAMACRTPVIGTPAGAAPDLLAKGGGYLVKAEDPQDMAEAIVRLCRLSGAEWRAMSDAAHKIATEYTWEEAADLFERALTAPGGGAVSCDLGSSGGTV